MAQNSEQGYKSVMKEYDFYNNNIDDFEIIGEIPSTTTIPTQNEKVIINKDNIQKSKYSEIKDKLKQFLTDLFRIIFESREYNSKSRQKLNELDFSGDYIEELTAYDDLKGSSDDKEDKSLKYSIYYYLYKKDINEEGFSKKTINNSSQKLLVEKWKIEYNLNSIFKKVNKDKMIEMDDFIDMNIKTIKKDIILYTHILPLYNICHEQNYNIEFEFNPNNKKIINFVDNKLIKKIKLAREEFFNFKISVAYLELKRENINKLFLKNQNDFIILENKKTRPRFFSGKYNKKSSTQLLKKESKDETKENNKTLINDLIIDNYFNDNSNNENKIKQKRLSVQKSKTNLTYFNYNVNDSLTDSDSDESLSLVVSESNGELKNKISKNSKISEEKNCKLNDENTINKKESLNEKQNLIEKPKIESSENNNLKNFEFKNTNISKVVKEYRNIKRMIETMQNYGYINCDKLFNFTSNS